MKSFLALAVEVAVGACLVSPGIAHGQANGSPAGIQREEEKPEITTRKEQDVVTARSGSDAVIYTVSSPSGIGGATISPRKEWPKKVVLRLKLRGLESLKISNGRVQLQASVLSHSGNPTLLSIKEERKERQVEAGSPYWTTIQAFQADGKPAQGLPGENGYFEVELPVALFAGQPKSLTIDWIDFYR